jgi:RimJ/RimL family protein N-acetyltransferase
MAASEEFITLYSPTKRVKLTSPIPELDESIAALRCAPTTLRYLKFFPETFSTEEARARRESRAKETNLIDLYVFALGDDGEYELAGSTGVFNVDNLFKCCEGGILVAPKFVGKGLTAEIFYTLFQYMFDEKGFHRMSFETSMENEPMRGWFEKAAGVRLEGVKKEWWTDKQGGWTDVASYALLESEWREEVKGRLKKRMLVKSGRS